MTRIGGRGHWIWIGLLACGFACGEADEPTDSAGAADGTDAGDDADGPDDADDDDDDADDVGDDDDGDDDDDDDDDDAADVGDDDDDDDDDRPDPPEIDPELLFFDDFEYAVGREDDPTTKAAAFTGAGWSGVKSEPSDNGANGFLYTVQAVPGGDAPLPGGGDRVLAVEARPDLLGFQTDFYVQLGGGEPDDAGAIPANVWFQFWMYSNYAGEQLSRYHTGKFLYVCDDFYPCHSHAWMVLAKPCASSPFMENEATPSACPFGEVSEGDLFFGLRSADGVSEIDYSGGAPWNADKLGPQTLDGYIPANTWTLVKMHMDTSGPVGTWEMWLRPLRRAVVQGRRVDRRADRGVRVERAPGGPGRAPGPAHADHRRRGGRQPLQLLDVPRRLRDGQRRGAAPGVRGRALGPSRM